MNARDFDYIETRLLAPCVSASEAYQRLQSCDYREQAAKLMSAMQTFTDSCREIRAETAKARVRETP